MCADIVTPAVRSRMMAGIRGKDTRPELVLRTALHRRGFRYRLHRRDLPGTPDLVFPGRKAVIFVHGCFWHGHDCHLFHWPQTRADFWRGKIGGNIARDRAQRVSESQVAWLGPQQRLTWIDHRETIGFVSRVVEVLALPVTDLVVSVEPLPSLVAVP